MNKKENRMAVRQAAEKTVIRDEQNRRIQFAATNPIKEVLKNLHNLRPGLSGRRPFHRLLRPGYGRRETSFREI